MFELKIKNPNKLKYSPENVYIDLYDILISGYESGTIFKKIEESYKRMFENYLNAKEYRINDQLFNKQNFRNFIKRK
jgi:hypothetical protein